MKNSLFLFSSRDLWTEEMSVRKKTNVRTVLIAVCLCLNSCQIIALIKCCAGTIYNPCEHYWLIRGHIFGITMYESYICPINNLKGITAADCEQAGNLRARPTNESEKGKIESAAQKPRQSVLENFKSLKLVWRQFCDGLKRNLVSSKFRNHSS